MNSNNLSDKKYNQLLESIGKEIDKKLNIVENKMILKRYGIYDMLYTDYADRLNEEHTYNDEEGEDLAEFKFIMGRLRYVIPSLMKMLIKKGLKKAVQLCVKSAKAAYHFNKDNPELVKNLFYGLLFFAIGYGGNMLKGKYNSNPTIPGTQIEYKDSTMYVKSGNDSITVVSQNDSESAPEIKVVPNKNNPSSAKWINQMQSEGRTVSVNPPAGVDMSVFEMPIHPLQKGEKKIVINEPSKEMVQAIAEVEHFVDHLYDTANKDKVLTMRDLKDLKKDITIGYGHAVKTLAERKKWFGKKISKQEAIVLFKADLQAHVNVTNNAVKNLPYYNNVNISQGFYDFLYSISYNAGSGNIFSYGNKIPMSEFWMRVNNIRYNKPEYIQQDLDYALAKINTQNTGSKRQGGLKIRRRAEYWIAKQPYGTIKPEIYHLLAPEYRDQ